MSGMGGLVAMRGSVEGFASVLAAASQAPGAGSDVSRIAPVTIAVAAVAAFTVLQVIALSRCRRDGGAPDWPS
jgi:hypothetical protein